MSMLKIGSLWKPKQDGGKSLASGKIDIPTDIILKPGMKIVLLPNKSGHEKSPFADVFIASSDESNAGQGGLGGVQGSNAFTTEDVPF